MSGNTQKQVCRWHSVADGNAMRQMVLDAILLSAREAIAARGKFSIVLCGGTTPGAVYRSLQTASADWQAWHVYLGDERCLPPQDAERNSRMIEDAWLAGSAIPREQIHFMHAERGAIAAATDYCATLKGVGDFDLVLLGLGEDGHTASLFPGHQWGTANDAPDALPVSNAPKPPPDRVSLSAARLSRARQVMYLVGGAGKREAVAAWRGGAGIPAAAITPATGVDIVIDAAAEAAGY